jgi:hypothetical protein
VEYKPDLDNILKRYQAFWNMDIYDRPPIRVRYPIAGQSDEAWSEAMQTPESYFAYHETVLRHRIDLGDDALPTATIDMAPGLWGGILGCEVMFGHGTSWSTHCLKDWSQMERFLAVSLNENNPWVNRVLDMIDYFIEKSAGKCMVGLPLPMGPGDMVTTLRGPTEICSDFFEAAEQLDTLLAACTQTWIDFFQLMFDCIPAYQGGYCDDYDIWTPGRSSYFANDIATLISPATYRQHFFKYDCQVAASNETPWMHIHSEEARLIPEFIKIPKLRAIQVVSDYPAGPGLMEILPLLKLVQENHGLILRKYPMAEIEEILPELAGRKLVVDTQCDSKKEAHDVLAKWTQRDWV